jgi:hypothetical protein
LWRSRLGPGNVAAVAMNRSLLTRSLIITAAVSFAGCDEPRPASWSYVHTAILRPACTTAGCHSQMTAIAGLDLSGSDGAYALLTGRVCGAPTLPGEAPRWHVDPYNPEGSSLMWRLRGEQIGIMPPDTPLPESEILLVEQWILGGALCD